MTAYLVTDARHTRELITLSYDDDTIMIRTFDYVYPARSAPRMRLSSVTSDLMQYTGGVGLLYNGKEYNQRWYQCLSWSKEQLVPGSTYIWATDDVIGRIFQVDAEKYPTNLDMSDWKYLRMCSYRPFFKLQVDYPHQPFSEMHKVFYAGSDKHSTSFISPEDITEVLSQDISLVPKFRYNINGSTIYIEADKKCCGLLHMLNRRNIYIDDVIPLEGHKAEVYYKKLNDNKQASFDLCFSFNKVLSIVL